MHSGQPSGGTHDLQGGAAAGGIRFSVLPTVQMIHPVRDGRIALQENVFHAPCGQSRSLSLRRQVPLDFSLSIHGAYGIQSRCNQLDMRGRQVCTLWNSMRDTVPIAAATTRTSPVFTGAEWGLGAPSGLPLHPAGASRCKSLGTIALLGLRFGSDVLLMRCSSIATDASQNSVVVTLWRRRRARHAGDYLL